MVDTNDYRVYALETLREYLVYNDVDIKDKHDLIKTFIIMREEGYFFKAVINKKMNEVRKTLNEYIALYEQNPTEIENELIVFGSRKILQRIDSISKK